MPLLALVAFPASASATATTVTMDVTVTEANTCPGFEEDVVLTGKVHTTTAINMDSVGGLHVKGSFDSRGLQGVGQLSGRKYQGVSVAENEVQIPLGATEFTFEFKYDLIRQGEDRQSSADDLHNKSLVHVTFDAAGGVHMAPPTFEAECR
jgi:hypothetical protein